MSKSFSELRARAIACGATSAYNVRGCSNEQIEEIERQAGVPLPKAYKEFLFMMGRGAGRLMGDLDVYYDSMLGLNKTAARILDNWEAGFILRAALREARSVIEESERLSLTSRDSLLVLELLENPPAPNAKLRKVARALPERS